MTTASDTGPAPESAPWPIGLITLGVKRTGKRRTGNPFAPFEVAGAGDGLTATLHGHEAGNGGYSQGKPTGHRASPRPYYAHVLACPDCGGRLRLIATLHDPAVIRKILAHLRIAPSGP